MQFHSRLFRIILIFIFFIFIQKGFGQEKTPSKHSENKTNSPAKQQKAQKIDGGFKIDGILDEEVWSTAVPFKDFVEWRPNAGRPEESTNRTVIYMLYDNTSVYIGGYCQEITKDSISTELVGRDVVGVNDFVGVIFDTYNDKINGFGFYVTALGEQFDAKYSNTAGEDGSWNGVWDSQSKVHDNGWSFEMRIPYSALRFSSTENQTWGLNITRRRNKSGKQYMWSPVDLKNTNFMSQSGSWTGIEKIEAPVRLSLSPYFSTYLNHFSQEGATKDWTYSVNGGMDVKYGINDAFTLDMTLVPDFGQVQSDNQVLNLSPFEVRFNENRPFFNEGTELFSKGDLFYSRRIGSTPLHYYDIEESLLANETIVANPQEAKLINATKVSGRNKKGLGIGVFNAITKRTYAEISNDEQNGRLYQTTPLTNYNIFVVDQTLKNNSSVSFINTNTFRTGNDYDANVSAALFDMNNKKNSYNWSGKVAVSHLTDVNGKPSTGYSHQAGFRKTSGLLLFQLSQELSDDKYDINDMGIQFNNNFLDHYAWVGYRWLKPKGIYNRMQVNYNANYSRRYMPGSYQFFFTNVNANIQLKSLWWVGAFIGYNAKGNDFYEPRTDGSFYRTPSSMRYNVWFESNEAKRYYLSSYFFTALPDMFNGRVYEYSVSQRFRFNDRFSLRHDFTREPRKNDAGFYEIIDSEVVFSRRDRLTVENVISLKYNFNNKSGITFRARHYWSKVTPKELFTLQDDGSLLSAAHYEEPITYNNINYFNIDAVYTLQFAPGSFLNIVWKNAVYTSDAEIYSHYFQNADRTIAAPQNNNLSIKLLYFLDYLDLRRWLNKK